MPEELPNIKISKFQFLYYIPALSAHPTSLALGLTTTGLYLLYEPSRGKHGAINDGRVHQVRRRGVVESKEAFIVTSLISSKPPPPHAHARDPPESPPD